MLKFVCLVRIKIDICKYLAYGTCKHFVDILEAIHKEIARLMVVKPEAKWNGKSWVFSHKDLQSMHYLHTSICESMHHYPLVILDSKHTLHKDVIPDGIIVCIGTRVNYQPYTMGHRDAIWGTDCLKFTPKRWLNKDSHFILQSPFKFAVFQCDARVCLGKYMVFIQ